MKFTLYLLFALICRFSSAHASHLAGSEITYRHLDGKRYEITLRVSSTTTERQRLTYSCHSSLYAFSWMTFKYTDSISSTCDSDNSSFFFNRSTYKDTVDFASSSFSSLLACSNSIKIELVANARYATTIVPGATMSNYTIINVDAQKSSVQFTSDPLHFVCCNVPTRYSLGVQNGNSNTRLVYSLQKPVSSLASSNWPLTVFNPGTPGQKNPNYNPPIGFSVNSDNGDVIFTPTSCAESTNIVLQVQEWQKSSTGTYELISVIRREQVMIVQTCPNNNPPAIVGPFDYNFCENITQCFNINVKDSAVISGNPLDLVSLDLSYEMDSANWYILDTTAKQETARFCWTPPLGSARDLPYHVLAHAKDTHCSPSSSGYRTINIRVKKETKGEVNITSLGCELYQVQGIQDNSFAGTASHLTTVYGINAELISDPDVMQFGSNNLVVS